MVPLEDDVELQHSLAEFAEKEGRNTIDRLLVSNLLQLNQVRSFIFFCKS